MLVEDEEGSGEVKWRVGLDCSTWAADDGARRCACGGARALKAPFGCALVVQVPGTAHQNPTRTPCDLVETSASISEWARWKAASEVAR